MGWTIAGLAGTLCVCLAAAPAAVLENDHARVTIDPAHGGAVTRMDHKHAPSVPLIRDRGAGLAGEGRFFAGVLAVGEKRLDLRNVKMQIPGGASARRVELAADLSALHPRLSIRRTLAMDANESGLRIVDTYRNAATAGAAAISLRVGAASRFDGHPWNRTLRCWVGDRRRGHWLFTPYGRGNVTKLPAASKEMYWRILGQYGTGLVYLPVAPAAPVEMVHRLPKEKGHPAEFDWLAAPVDVPAGGQVSVRSAVLIDTGGRPSEGAASLLGADRVIVHADLPSAGRRGRPMDCFVTVTSPTPRRVRVVVTEHYVLLNWGGEKDRTKPKEATSFELDLRPGVGAERHFRHRPAHVGLVYLRCEVRDLAGAVLGAASPRAVIDGKKTTSGEFAQTWKYYTQRLEEVHLRGTWEEIGRQMARRKLIRPARHAGGAKRLAFHDKAFPFYGRLLRGAAAELKTHAAKLAAMGDSPGRPAPPAAACMGLLVHGPDGPIHLYSKERSGSSRRGMGYVKVVPDAGHRYHMYTLGNATFGYGVNDAGLSTSGATINCDAETDRRGREETKRRLAGGAMTAPLGMHMLMASCATVDEAVRFVTRADAPLDFTGNLLLADRAGNAAVLESVGTYQQVLRRRRGDLATMGNYPHRRTDGLFDIGANWGWAANTMLRERLVRSLVDEWKGQVSLADALAIMATQTEPGGMCQHVFDNVGLLYSTCSSIAVLKTGDLYISHGPPDRVEYVRYRLGD